MTVAKGIRHRGERAISRKTIAWGMPDVSGASAVNTRVHIDYPQRTRGCGCIGHPAFPAPSSMRAGLFEQNSRDRRGEIAKSYLRRRGLTFESADAPYDSSSRRTPGPITTIVCWSRSRQPRCQNARPRRMGPHFRGDDVRDCTSRHPSLRSSRKAAVFELRFQPHLLGHRLLDVVVLDMAVAADRFGNPSEPREMRNLFHYRCCEALLDHRKIILD